MINNYIDFKRQYLGALTRMLNEPVGTGPIIGTPESRRLAVELSDLEEAHPAWTERVEDWLSEQAPPEGWWVNR